MSTISSVTFFTTRHSHAQQRAWPTRHWKDEFYKCGPLTKWRPMKSRGQLVHRSDKRSCFHGSKHLRAEEDDSVISYSLTQMCKLNSWDPKSLQCTPPPIPKSCLLFFLLLALHPNCDAHHCSSVVERDTRAEGALLLLVSFRVSLKPQPASGNTRNWDKALSQKRSYQVTTFCTQSFLT